MIVSGGLDTFLEKSKGGRTHDNAPSSDSSFSPHPCPSPDPLDTPSPFPTVPSTKVAPVFVSVSGSSGHAGGKFGSEYSCGGSWEVVDDDDGRAGLTSWGWSGGRSSGSSVCFPRTVWGDASRHKCAMSLLILEV